jgi:nicotinamide riboside kinase
MTQKDKDLIYERVRNKIYEHYSEFKECMLSGDLDVEIVYNKAEEITFRETLTFFVITSNYLEVHMPAENCKILINRFGNRILKTLYTRWVESDFDSLGIDELSTMINSFCDRLKAEKNYYDFVKLDQSYSTSYKEAFDLIYNNETVDEVETDDE